MRTTNSETLNIRFGLDQNPTGIWYDPYFNRVFLFLFLQPYQLAFGRVWLGTIMLFTRKSYNIQKAL